MTKRRMLIGGLGVAWLGMLVCCSENKPSSGGATGGSYIYTGGTTPAPGTGGTGTGASSGTAGKCPLENIKLSGSGCGEGLTSSQLRTANVLLVIDKSGSMDGLFPGSTGTKWEGMRTALSTALNQARIINFGLDLFPAAEVPKDCRATSPTDNECCQTKSPSTTLDVPIGSGATTVDEIIAKLNATNPGGGTPTAAALARAYYYFDSGAGALLQGDKYVLLATDGGPNCNLTITSECAADLCTRNLDHATSGTTTCTETGPTCCNSPVLYSSCLDDLAVRAQLEALKLKGISTFVVGIPGSDPYIQYLNAFAEAGGTAQAPTTPDGPTYYEVKDAAQLVQTFQKITVDLVRSCELPTVTEIVDDKMVTVLKNCLPIPTTDFVAVGGSKLITITGNTCEEIKNQGADRVDYILGCTPVF